MFVGISKRQTKNAEARKNCVLWRLEKSKLPCDSNEREINREIKNTLLQCSLSESLKIHEIFLGGVHFKAGDPFHQTRFSIRATLSRIVRRLKEGTLPLIQKRLTGAEKKKRKKQRARSESQHFQN